VAVRGGGSTLPTSIINGKKHSNSDLMGALKKKKKKFIVERYYTRGLDLMFEKYDFKRDDLNKYFLKKIEYRLRFLSLGNFYLHV
jgi:hypothetical protein